jgi:parallel beta-helix repeat protein
MRLIRVLGGLSVLVGLVFGLVVINQSSPLDPVGVHAAPSIAAASGTPTALGSGTPSVDGGVAADSAPSGSAPGSGPDGTSSSPEAAEQTMLALLGRAAQTPGSGRIFPPDTVRVEGDRPSTTIEADPAESTTTQATTPPTTVTPSTIEATTSTTSAAQLTSPVPPGAVEIHPGSDVASIVGRHPAGTTFYLRAGTHTSRRIYPRDGDRFVGEAGAVFSGHGSDAILFSGDATGVVIEGLVFEYFASPSQSAPIHTGPGAHGWIIRDNEFRHNTRGVSVNSGFQVIDNYIHRNDQVGIGGTGRDVIIRGNEIAFNNHRNATEMAWEAGGMKLVNTERAVISGNFVHDNHGPGLWTDGANVGTVYEQNVVIGNYGPGIFHEISYEAVIRNNRVEGNAHRFYVGGILVANSPGVEVYGNRLSGNNGGVVGIQDERGSGPRGRYDLQNLWVHDNEIGHTTGWTGVRRNAGSEEVYSGWNNRFDRNVYRVGDQAKPFYWAGAERTREEWVGYGHDVNATWR